MPRLEKINVELTLPFLGKISGQWAPDEAERQAAWEMYVELATRITIQPLAPGEGLLREALTSYYSLFATTRTILREHGPRVAQPSRDGDLSFGYLALAILNGALRPLLSRWHPELLNYEQAARPRRPPATSNHPTSHPRLRRPTRGRRRGSTPPSPDRLLHTGPRSGPKLAERGR